jgi:NADPH2:quinone reductase
MPKAVVCRELGPPENLRLETFAPSPLAEDQVRVTIRAAGINFPDILGASVLGVRAGEAVRKNPALGHGRLKALTEWAEAGKIRPNISHRLPLENYAQAMRLLIDRKAIGRVALMMR